MTMRRRLRATRNKSSSRILPCTRAQLRYNILARTKKMTPINILCDRNRIFLYLFLFSGIKLYRS